MNKNRCVLQGPSRSSARAVAENALLEQFPRCLSSEAVHRLDELRSQAQALLQEICIKCGRPADEIVRPGWPPDERPGTGRWALTFGEPVDFGWEGNWIPISSTIRPNGHRRYLWGSPDFSDSPFAPWQDWARAINLPAVAVVTWAFAASAWGIDVSIRMFIGPTADDVDEHMLGQSIETFAVSPRFFSETEAEFLQRAREAFQAGTAKWLEHGCMRLHDQRKLRAHCRWLIDRRVKGRDLDKIAAMSRADRDTVDKAIRRLSQLLNLPAAPRGRPRVPRSANNSAVRSAARQPF